MNRPEQKYALIRKKKGKRTADPLHRAPVFLGVLYVTPRRSQKRGEVLRAPSVPPRGVDMEINDIPRDGRSITRTPSP